MRKITLSEGAQIAEIVAAIAVVVSLLYVGLQLRANTAAVRSASIQAITSTTADVLLVQSSNPELIRIRRVGDEDHTSLSDDEAYQYYLFYRQFWLNHQNNHFQRRLGVIDDDVWGVFERIICFQTSKSGVRATWPDHTNVLDAAFIAIVEQCPEFARADR